MPNFCPECGSSQATSRFCSSCGYSLASTPAPPDASTRVEDTPVFHPFAPPVVETWDSLAADPWSSTAGAVTPPVRNVVTQTPVAVSETKLTAITWLWRIFLLATIAYGVIDGRAYALALGDTISVPSRSMAAVANSSDALYVFGVLALVALLTMTGVAASAARQVGARTPHPALAVLLVIGAAIAAITLGWLISPEYWADVEIASLYDKGLDRRILYGVALLIQSLAVYVVALAPVVALSKAVGPRYSSGNFSKSEISVVNWASVWFSALVVGAYDVITAMMVFRAWGFGWIHWAFLIGFIFRLLWENLDFKTRSEEANFWRVLTPDEDS